MTASHFSVGKSSMGATCWIPALLMSMSGWPKDLAQLITILAISSGLAMLAPEYAVMGAPLFMSEARSASTVAASAKPFIMTLAATAASALAYASAMLEIEPVASPLFPNRNI